MTKPPGSTSGGADTTDLPHLSAALWSRTGESATPVAPGQPLDLDGPFSRPATRAATATPAQAASGESTSAAAALAEFLLAGGQVAVSVAWYSQHSGQSGSATPLPQGDAFGFLYFSDPENPEVFVKALDWGAGTPFLLFAAGLTDFGYTATFRNVRSGQVVVFSKPPGGYGGFADATSMMH